MRKKTKSRSRSVATIIAMELGLLRICTGPVFAAIVPLLVWFVVISLNMLLMPSASPPNILGLARMASKEKVGCIQKYALINTSARRIGVGKGGELGIKYEFRGDDL